MPAAGHTGYDDCSWIATQHMQTRAGKPAPTPRPNGPRKRSPQGRRITWKKALPWLALLPAFAFLALAAMYLSIIRGFAAPPDLILGAQGLEILDRNGEIVYTF